MDIDVRRSSHDEIWKNDVLDREADAEFLERFLLGRINERAERGLPKSYVLNIDAKWGFGKSFFLDRFGQSLKLNGHVVASVNAWKDDHADDPLLPVMLAIDEALKPLIQRRKNLEKTWNSVKRSGAAVAVAVAKGAAKHWSKKLIGDGVEDALEALELAKDNPTIAAAEKDLDREVASFFDREANLLLQQFKEGKRTIETFRAELASFLKSLDKDGERPLFVLVDELDRCRPTYAIALLERVKHLFDIDNVVFVIATDSSQLRHAIGAVYGSSFDGTKYLARFFDRTYTFSDPTPMHFTELLMSGTPINEEKISCPPNGNLLTYLSGAFKFFGLSLRDIEQCFEIIRSVVTVWNYPLKVEMAVLVPLAIGYQQRIPVALSAEFVKILGELAQNARGNRSDWILTFVRRIPGQGAEDHKITGLELFELFAQMAARPLGSGREDLIGAAAWVDRVFDAEFAIIHNNMRRIVGGPVSKIRDYPSIVATAGRLVPKSDKV